MFPLKKIKNINKKMLFLLFWLFFLLTMRGLFVCFVFCFFEGGCKQEGQRESIISRLMPNTRLDPIRS